MKLGSALLYSLAVLSVAACSKEDSGGSVNRDISQFKVESLTGEQSLTESDYSSRLQALKVKGKACRGKVFGSYKKGDRFVLSTRVTEAAKEGTTKTEVVINETVVSVRDAEMTFSKSIESINGVAQTGKSSILRKCVSRKGRVSCSTNSKGTEECSIENKKPIKNIFSEATYALQDGRTIPVLVSRSEFSAQVLCRTAEKRDIKLSEVHVKSGSVKSNLGQDCALGNEAVQVYGYAMIEQADGQFLSEADTRVLYAPAK